MQDHLLGPQGSLVNKRILQWLLRYPLQRVEDIVLALNVSTNTIYRHMTRLVEDGLIECVTPSLGAKTTCRFYYLSNVGIYAAAGLEGDDAKTLAHTWGAHEKGLLDLLPRLTTLARLHTLLNELIAQAPIFLTQSGGHRTNLAWHWVRDYQHRFLADGHSKSMYADVALLLYRKTSQQKASDANYYSTLLLIDPGFVGQNDHDLIAQRLEMIHSYRDSAERKQQLPHFPPVLVLVQSPHQREIWQRYVIEVATRHHTKPLTGAILSLPPQETPHAVWTAQWQKLSTPVHCRLSDIFVATSKEMLLPELLKRKGKREAQAVLSSPAKTSRLLKGDFASRVKTLNHLPGDDKRERETVALLGLCLSQRHQELLRFLYAHPLLETKELSTLLQLHTDSVTRYLYELRHYACIEKRDTEYGGRWQLSPRGLRFIAASCQIPLLHLAERCKSAQEAPIVQKNVSVLASHIDHTVAIYSFFSALHQSASNQTGHAVLWWETGGRCTHHYYRDGTWHILQPDAAFAYKADKAQIFAWLEWITKSRPSLFEKLRAYAHYVRGREWAAEGLAVPPILLIVVPDSSQERHVAQTVDQYLAGSGPEQALTNRRQDKETRSAVRNGVGRGMRGRDQPLPLQVRLTTARLIETHGPVAAIWSQASSNSQTHIASMAGQPLRRMLLDLSQ